MSSNFLRIGSCLVELLFGIATLLGEKMLRIKISTEELLCRSRNNEAQHQLYQKKYIFEKLTFQKINISHFLLSLESFFLEKPVFQTTILSIAATFSEELLSHNILFQKSCYLTATSPLHYYSYYLSVSN